MTKDQLKEASELWALGEKTKIIADRMGISKQNMSWIAAQNRDLFPARAASFYRASGFSAGNIEARARAKTAIKERFPPKAPGHEGVPRGRLTACGCQFPLWGDHERYNEETSLYCGAYRVPGTKGLYCGFHAQRTTGPGTRSEREATNLRRVAA